MNIQNLDQLEEVLSRPRAADVSAMKQIQGDLLILGVGGKMGPSLARLARRASDDAGVRRSIVAVARFSNQELPAELWRHRIKTIACDARCPEPPAQRSERNFHGRA
jgi:hypothetical protein